MSRISMTIPLLLAALSGRAAATDIPVNIGVGPAAFYIPERLDDGEPELL